VQSQALQIAIFVPSCGEAQRRHVHSQRHDFSQLVANTQPIVHSQSKYLTHNAKFSSGEQHMRSTSNNNIHNSSQFITFLADFGIPVKNSASLEPSMTLLSDFGNGTVWQNGFHDDELTNYSR
jgi:hypothetical protein